MSADLLAGASWRCVAAPPGGSADPASHDGWIDAPVPGTVASALVAAGMDPLAVDIDGHDWWYATRVEAPEPVSVMIESDGLAGVAEVRVNGRVVGVARSMFLEARWPAELGAGANDLVIRFEGVRGDGAPRRPRPRWRVARLRESGLRWARQTLLGRLVGAPPTPPPIGPWRGIRAVPEDTLRVTSRRLRPALDAEGRGTLSVSAVLRGALPPGAEVSLILAGSVHPVRIEADDAGGHLVTAEAGIERVERWWPRGAGAQPLYEVALRVGAETFPLGRVGFRDIRVDDADGGFRFVVNGSPLFVGGAVWAPPDSVGLVDERTGLRELLQRAVDGGLTMLRVPGDTLFESDAFYELCDELGIMVWQDCPLAFSDPPADPEWEALVVAEAAENLERLSGHPSLCLVSGGTEIAQQAVYAGVSLRDGLPLLTDRLPGVVAEAAGSVAYLPTSPWGGDVPTRPDSGVSHYYGVGAYLREREDARRARPRFAAECLAFAVPPQRSTVDLAFGGAAPAGHDPAWKRAVYRDAGASWDFEDVRDHYVRRLFDVDPLEVRRSDPDRYLELGRATVARLVEGVFAEWRRAGSSSGGGLVLSLLDALPGAGLGMLDARGIPKSSWYAARRALAPIAVAVSDEGLNGLVAHVHNATPDPVAGAVRVELFRGEIRVDSAERAVVVPPRDSASLGIDAMFDGFRDLAWAHRFGPLTYDTIAVALVRDDGGPGCSTAHRPGGETAAAEEDPGLEVEATEAGPGRLLVEVRTRRFARFVSVDAAGWVPDDCGFDLPPGGVRIVRLTGSDAARPAGSVRALNGSPVGFRADGRANGRTPPHS